MNIKTSLTALLAIALAIPALAADASGQPLTVAVYDFKGVADAQWGNAKFGDKVTALVTADLATQTNIVLLERAQLDKALNEQAFGISGLVSSDAAAKIGAITGAKVLVSGEVLRTRKNHLVIVANIIGTETGRLFAVKTEGPIENLMDLTSDLSSNIDQTIVNQTTNLTAAAPESSAARIERIVKSITGTNRPSVAVNILYPTGKSRHSATAEGEFGMILLKAGFPVVDAHSDRKADVEIKGVDDLSGGPRQGGLFSYRCVIELKVQQRRSGNIIAIDREESIATDAMKVGADRGSQAQAVDGLAERVLPLLAK